MIKKYFSFICLLLCLGILTGCQAVIVDSEEQRLKSIYLTEMPIPDATISPYYVDFKITNNNHKSKETYEKIDELQKWLEELSNSEIVDVVPDIHPNEMGITGLTFMFKDTDFEHDYRITTSYTTNNIKGYVSSIKIPLANSSPDNFYIVIFDNNSDNNVKESKQVEELYEEIKY